MLAYITVFLIFGILVCCIYYTPVIIRKICHFLDRSVLGYCIKICLLIAFVCGILYFMYFDGSFQTNKERLLCNKATDTCTYSVTTYGNDEFEEKNTFPISKMKSVVLKKYKVEHRARYFGVYFTNRYVIKLSDNYYTYFEYPIVRDDYEEARETLNRFKAFIYNDETTEYQDFKDNYIDELIIFFTLVAAIITLLVIYNDFQRWKKTRSPKDT